MKSSHFRLPWRYLLLGAILGLPLGLGVGYFASAPAFGSNPGIGQTLLLVGLAIALLIAFVVRAATKRSSRPLVAAAAMIAASVLGLVVAPGAPGSFQHASGAGSAGTPQAPTAFWSGSVTCNWQKDQDTTVKDVVGFDVRVSDIAVATALGLNPGDKVVAITLPTGGTTGDALPGVGEDSSHYQGGGRLLTLENVSANGSSGSAVASKGAIVFAWSCSHGP